MRPPKYIMHLLLGALTINLTSNDTLFPVTLFCSCLPKAAQHSFDWPEHDALSPLPFFVKQCSFQIYLVHLLLRAFDAEIEGSLSVSPSFGKQSDD